MRASQVRSAAVLAVLGAVVGVVVALGLRWWDVRDAPDAGTPRRYVDYLPGPPSTDWWALLWPGALTGAIVGLLVFAALLVAKRRLTLERTR